MEKWVSTSEHNEKERKNERKNRKKGRRKRRSSLTIPIIPILKLKLGSATSYFTCAVFPGPELRKKCAGRISIAHICMLHEVINDAELKCEVPGS